jgi:hypothetical protein
MNITAHVECTPDEALLRKIGFTKKQISHHQGKSRVYADILRKNGQVALVDEDPGQASHPYIRNLILQAEEYGIKYFLDRHRNNKVFVLKVKLEDWIIAACQGDKVKMHDFGLPDKPNDLHEVIIHRLKNFESLLDFLQTNKNKPIRKLKDWMTAN